MNHLSPSLSLFSFFFESLLLFSLCFFFFSYSTIVALSLSYSPSPEPSLFPPHHHIFTPLSATVHVPSPPRFTNYCFLSKPAFSPSVDSFSPLRATHYGWCAVLLPLKPTHSSWVCFPFSHSGLLVLCYVIVVIF